MKAILRGSEDSVIATFNSSHRSIKDAMSRDIMAALDQAGIGIASATQEITLTPATIEQRESARQM